MNGAVADLRFTWLPFHLAIGYRPSAIYLSRVNILEELNWRGLVADCTDTVELTKQVSAPTTLYCGFPRAINAILIAREVFAERGLLPVKTTTEG